MRRTWVQQVFQLTRVGLVSAALFAGQAQAADIRLLTDNPVKGANYTLLDLGNNDAISTGEMGGDAFFKNNQQVSAFHSDPAIWTSESGIYIGEGGGSYRSLFLMTTWQTLPNSRVIEISGDIQAGDTEKLKNLVRDTQFSKCIAPGLCPFNNTISLNSAGGSLTEAIKLGEYIASQNFATLIKENAICESACAFTFFGGYTDYEGYFFPRRYVHETASLGIHRPYFNLPVRNYSSDEVEQVVGVLNDVVNRATSYLLEVGIDLGLLKRMYNTPATEMYRLSALEMSAQQIFILGQQRRVSELTRRQIFAYCSTIYQSAYSKSSPELLANLQTNGSAFLTFVAGNDFICAGAKQISTDTWRSHICTGDYCGLANFAQNEVYYYQSEGKTVTPTMENIAVAIDVHPIGAALREYRHRSALLRYIRLFAEAHDFLSFPAIPYASINTPVPDPYCDQIDGYDPALVLAVQAGLNESGIDVGKPDGAAGPNTRRGIQKFNATQVGREEETIQIDTVLALGIPESVATPFRLCP